MKKEIKALIAALILVEKYRDCKNYEITKNDIVQCLKKKLNISSEKEEDQLKELINQQLKEVA